MVKLFSHNSLIAFRKLLNIQQRCRAAGSHWSSWVVLSGSAPYNNTYARVNKGYCKENWGF